MAEKELSQSVLWIIQAMTTVLLMGHLKGTASCKMKLQILGNMVF